MTASPRYGVFGAGRQGTAAAHFIATRADPAGVLVADRDAEAASKAAARINRLAGTEIALAREVDVQDATALAEALTMVDVAVCATPFRFILPFTRAAIASGTGMVDLGGHTETVRRQLELDEEARAAGVTVVPDCGMGPGMSNVMGLAALERLRQNGAAPYELRLWEGGLPMEPDLPWQYVSAFDVEGLTNEYEGEALFLRDGRVTRVEALTEPEEIHFDGVGTLEAFVTSGGTSTLAPYLEGTLTTLENKTCRYPGHLVRFRAFRDLGLFSSDPVVTSDGPVSPRALYHALLSERLAVEHIEDVCFIRARAVGRRGPGGSLAATIELIDHHQPETGFSAMERVTGGHAALMATRVGRGEIPAGVRTLEHTVSPLSILDEARVWGFTIREHLETPGPD